MASMRLGWLMLELFVVTFVGCASQRGRTNVRYTIASRITGSAGHDGRTFPYGA